jgi:vacuolar protein sorting-associated protein 45
MGLISVNVFVWSLQEFYADFCAIDQYHFTLNISNNHMYMLPTVVDPPGMQSFCDRAVDGIASVFLALKRRPIIRYQRTSDAAKRIARETAVGQLSLCNVSIKII